MKNSYGKVRYLLVLLMALGRVNSPSQGPISFTWPAIQPIHKDYKFLMASQADVDIPILGVDGKALYRLRCTPDFPSKNGPIGALACYLITVPTQDEGIDTPTLLNDDPMDDMVAHGRGQISSYELEKDCANYPEYGSDRTFRLRAMKVSLHIDDVEFAPAFNTVGELFAKRAIRTFNLQVTVTSDPKALSAIAEPVPFAPPKLREPADREEAAPDCSTVIRAHVPGNPSDEFVERQRLSAPFPSVARAEKTLALEARKLQGHDFAFPGYPMSAKARMVSFPVLSSEGNHAYDFACSGYATRGLFQRYGIVCGLFLPGKDFNLLADDVDPYSRMSPSQILPRQLYGDCGGYPEWGKRRVFRLRGMKLTVLLSDPIFVTGDFEDRALASVQLRVQIEPDPSATSPVAAPPTTIYWGVTHGPHACAAVLVAPSQASR